MKVSIILRTDELKVLNKSIVINVQLEFINVKIEYTDRYYIIY